MESIINLEVLSIQVQNKYFWIRKLKLDNLEMYIQFLDLINITPFYYQKLITIDKCVQDFIYIFKGYNARMCIELSDDINLKLLKINDLTIAELRNNFNSDTYTKLINI